MRKILFVTQSQFGYLIDYYKYAEHLLDKFEIEFVCWDYNQPRINMEGVKVNYISRSGNLMMRNFRFIREVQKLIQKDKSLYEAVIINYFRGCSILPFFNNKKILLLDVRTAAVIPSKVRRKAYDKFLKLESRFYSNISVISENIKRRLKLPSGAVILPLGADKIDIAPSRRPGLHLIYVGKLLNRNIHETVEGVGIFIKDNPNVEITYKIIGAGNKKTISKIQKCIEEYELDEIVDLRGYVKHKLLYNYYCSSNVGVSYVPVNEYFEYQPVTKTFEYLMAGIPVIATNTFGNLSVVNSKNGIIINDNPNSFKEGLEKIMAQLDFYNQEEIKHTVYGNEWINVVKILENLIDNKLRSK